VKRVLDEFPPTYPHSKPAPALVAKWIHDAGVDDIVEIVKDHGYESTSYITKCVQTRVAKRAAGIPEKKHQGRSQHDFEEDIDGIARQRSTIASS